MNGVVLQTTAPDVAMIEAMKAGMIAVIGSTIKVESVSALLRHSDFP